MRRGGPQRLAPAVAALAAELSPETPLARIQRVWTAAVGDGVSAQARPVAERDGVVTVACRSSVWAQELDLLSGELVERLCAALGNDSAVTRLRCVATPPEGFA